MKKLIISPDYFPWTRRRGGGSPNFQKLRFYIQCWRKLRGRKEGVGKREQKTIVVGGCFLCTIDKIRKGVNFFFSLKGVFFELRI